MSFSAEFGSKTSPSCTGVIPLSFAQEDRTPTISRKERNPQAIRFIIPIMPFWRAASGGLPVMKRAVTRG